MKELCKQLKVWQDPEVDLRGVTMSSGLSVKSKNEELLKVFADLATCACIAGAKPFYQDPAIMDNLELKMLKELPPGDMVFFPFAPINQPVAQRDSSHCRGARQACWGGWSSQEKPTGEAMTPQFLQVRRT